MRGIQFTSEERKYADLRYIEEAAAGGGGRG